MIQDILYDSSVKLVEWMNAKVSDFILLIIISKYYCSSYHYLQLNVIYNFINAELTID